MTYMDPAGKLMAEKAVKAIKDRGHTNLSGGLLAALQVLSQCHKSIVDVVSIHYRHCMRYLQAKLHW